MPKTIIGTGDANGEFRANSDNDVFFSAMFIDANGDSEHYGHEEVVNGVEFSVEEGKAYSVIVFAVFAEDGEAVIECTVGEKVKTTHLSGDVEPPGQDFEQAQFDIYA